MHLKTLYNSVGTLTPCRVGFIQHENLRALCHALPRIADCHAGDLATIERRAAVVKLNGIHLTGFVGWLFCSIVHVYFLIGVRNRFVVAFSWLWNYLSYQRGARLITGEGTPEPASMDRVGNPGEEAP